MTKGTVSGVIANMVTLSVDGPVSQACRPQWNLSAAADRRQSR